MIIEWMLLWLLLTTITHYDSFVGRYTGNISSKVCCKISKCFSISIDIYASTCFLQGPTKYALALELTFSSKVDILSEGVADAILVLSLKPSNHCKRERGVLKDAWVLSSTTQLEGKSTQYYELYMCKLYLQLRKWIGHHKRPHKTKSPWEQS